MSILKTGYRALPQFITHPSRSRRYTEDEFASMQKMKIQEAPSLCDGHVSTTVWYVEQTGYIIEIRFTSHAPVYIHSICTFTPTYGMDNIDGAFAQDAEEYVLMDVLDFQGQRLTVYHNSNDVPVRDYLKTMGLIK